MFDYFRISLPAFFVIALTLCAVTPVCLFWQPISLLGRLYFYAPYVAFVLWLGVIVMCVRVHRWQGLWLLATAALIVPITYVHFGLVVMCAFTGNCL